MKKIILLAVLTLSIVQSHAGLNDLINNTFFTVGPAQLVAKDTYVTNGAVDVRNYTGPIVFFAQCNAPTNNGSITITIEDSNSSSSGSFTNNYIAQFRLSEQTNYTTYFKVDGLRRYIRAWAYASNSTAIYSLSATAKKQVVE